MTTQITRTCRRVLCPRNLRIHVPHEKRAARRWLRRQGKLLLDDGPRRYAFAGYLS
jgi:hypothetical protein